MARTLHISSQRQRRAQRTHAKVSGTSERPRLVVFKSNEHIQAQIIDDTKGTTVCAVHDRELKGIKADKEMSKRMKEAFETGTLLAEKAKKKKITTVVFDRGGAKYHGRIAAFAEGARKGGLQF